MEGYSGEFCSVALPKAGDGFGPSRTKRALNLDLEPLGSSASVLSLIPIVTYRVQVEYGARRALSRHSLAR